MSAGAGRLGAGQCLAPCLASGRAQLAPAPCPSSILVGHVWPGPDTLMAMQPSDLGALHAGGLGPLVQPLWSPAISLSLASGHPGLLSSPSPMPPVPEVLPWRVVGSVARPGPTVARSRRRCSAVWGREHVPTASCAPRVWSQNCILWAGPGRAPRPAPASRICLRLTLPLLPSCPKCSSW